MRSILTSNKLVVALVAGLASAAAVLEACSSSNANTGGNGLGTGDDASTGSGGNGGGGSVSNQPGSCANPTIPIVFSPMYSAFVTGSTAQTFSLPVVTGDGNAATWSLSDPTQANLQSQSFMVNGANQPGVMITLAGAGDSDGHVTIVATESDGSCGSAVLSITTNTENDWSIGNARYNDGVALHLGAPAGFEGGIPDGGFRRPDGGGYRSSDGGTFFEVDGGTACTNCHGATATSGPFKDVSHTPEQTAGFSDTDLANIILNGEVPDGGYFDPTVINSRCDGGPACTAMAYQEWHSFHQWSDIAQDELPGIICYLRSLAPQAQNGSSNFGGGGRHRDGGGPPNHPSDAGTAGD